MEYDLLEALVAASDCRGSDEMLQSNPSPPRKNGATIMVISQRGHHQRQSCNLSNAEFEDQILSHLSTELQGYNHRHHRHHHRKHHNRALSSKDFDGRILSHLFMDDDHNINSSTRMSGGQQHQQYHYHHRKHNEALTAKDFASILSKLQQQEPNTW